MRTKLKYAFILILVMAWSFLTTARPPLEKPAEITNQDKPKKGTWDFHLLKEWEITEINGEVFGHISRIVSSEKGTLYLIERKISKIHILDKDGKYISSFGNKGEGPGEFKQMGRCFVTGNKLLFPDRPKMHYFSLDGKYLESKLIPNKIRPRSMVNDHLIISVPYINWQDQDAKGNFTIYDIENKKRNLLFEFSTFKKGIVRKSSGKSTSTYSYSSSSLTPMMSLHYQPGTKRLYYGMTDNYKITVRDLSDVLKGGKGKDVLVFSLERPKKKVPKGFKDELLKDIDWPDNIKKQIKNGFPDTLTCFTGFRSDERGYIYVSHNEPNVEDRRTMDIFSPEGIYIYKAVIRVEEGLSIRRRHWHEDHLYMVTEDEDGEVKLTKYKIKHPL